jgi:hypothetical protein
MRAPHGPPSRLVVPGAAAGDAQQPWQRVEVLLAARQATSPLSLEARVPTNETSPSHQPIVFETGGSPSGSGGGSNVWTWSPIMHRFWRKVESTVSHFVGPDGPRIYKPRLAAARLQRATFGTSGWRVIAPDESGEWVVGTTGLAVVAARARVTADRRRSRHHRRS